MQASVRGSRIDPGIREKNGHKMFGYVKITSDKKKIKKCSNPDNTLPNYYGAVSYSENV